MICPPDHLGSVENYFNLIITYEIQLLEQANGTATRDVGWIVGAGESKS